MTVCVRTFTPNPGPPWLLIRLPSFVPSPWGLPQSGSCLGGNTTWLFFIRHFHWLWGNLFINRKLSAYLIHGTENSQGGRLDRTPSTCLCPCSPAECVSWDFSGIFFWQRNTHPRWHFSFNILLYLMLGQGQGGNKCVQKINSLSTFANNRRSTVEDSKTYHLVWWNFIKIHCDGLKIQLMRRRVLTFSRSRINSDNKKPPQIVNIIISKFIKAKYTFNSHEFILNDSGYRPIFQLVLSVLRCKNQLIKYDLIVILANNLNKSSLS